MIENTFQNRVLGKVMFGCAMLACALAGAFSSAREVVPSPAMQAVEVPQQWEGAIVRPLALSAVERRFADRFPGRITRLTDERQIIVLRDVTAPTRMLHPAADCYRALGYRIEGEHLESTPAQSAMTTVAMVSEESLGSGLQRCFIARKEGVALRVCEQIEDANGQRFADTSAWYWAATMGQSKGPWRAVTVTRALAAGAV
ncbi:hypothetical protein [Ottowia thiooxydans]|uniref:hypothetical protein n=1 Tax=Ottowia thiooxydans TaxID=219182 RepID=UPI000411BE5B|nr:hypothetical protein [Ottowia thiooxydans]